MDQSASLNPIALQVLNHSLYELRKGVRPLFMLTLERAGLAVLTRQLQRFQTAYYVQPVTDSKINLFFGKPALVETARRIACRPLSDLSPEEDFILGTLLGYDREQQCERYLQRIAVKSPAAQLCAAAAC